jgi:transcriptional regulator with XRE-family HTH domain
LRKAKKWTQEHLAEKVGCHKRTVENAEAGKRVKETFLAYIAEALGVPLQDVVAPDSRRHYSPIGDDEVSIFDFFFREVDFNTMDGELRHSLSVSLMLLLACVEGDTISTDKLAQLATKVSGGQFNFDLSRWSVDTAPPVQPVNARRSSWRDGPFV